MIAPFALQASGERDLIRLGYMYNQYNNQAAIIST